MAPVKLAPSNKEVRPNLFLKKTLNGVGVDGAGVNFFFFCLRFPVVFALFFSFFSFRICLSPCYVFFVFFDSGEFGVFCTFPGSCCRLSSVFSHRENCKNSKQGNFAPTLSTPTPTETFRLKQDFWTKAVDVCTRNFSFPCPQGLDDAC